MCALKKDNNKLTKKEAEKLNTIKPAKIKGLLNEEQPREKATTYGIANLTDIELLAILINNGNRQSSVIDLARQLYQLGNQNLDEVAKLTPEKIKGIKGIGKAKATTIQAAFEISNRRTRQASKQSKSFTDSDAVFKYLHSLMGHLLNEEFYCLYFDSKMKLLAHKAISKGNNKATIINFKDILQHAFNLNAYSIIAAHNHPSGHSQPSQQDIDVTQKLATACKSVDVTLVDHLIITHNSYYSFANEGLL
jgi:DNA repair protein RadC